MRLFNTLSRKIEVFQPIKPPQVGLYACGFTVYDYTHLGHLRKYSLDDVLVRVLRHAGYQVKFVQNVTDVGHLTSDQDTGEDKMEKGAKKYGQSVWDVAKKFEDYFFYSMDLMGNLRPDISCRATEHIQEQLQMVIKLEQQGYAYVIKDDGVYFDTSKNDDYGQLARLDIEHLQEGARVEVVKGKLHPTDFALWKFERPGENRAMVWPSPWAKRSFPGWHIECSAMSIKYLGEQFDVHTGGIDHIPVHHTNEIAQTEAMTGKKPFVKYWVHHNHLRVANQKMSKSLGNFFTIDDVITKGFSPMALRLLFLTTHYRSEMNFTWESLEGSQKAYAKLVRAAAQWRAVKQAKQSLSPTALQLQRVFFDFLEDDLKTPEAMAIMWQVMGESQLTDPEKLQLVKEFAQVLGLDLSADQIPESTQPLSQSQLPTQVKELLKQRQQARQEQDWTKADGLRNEISQLGYQVIDEADSQKIILK